MAERWVVIMAGGSGTRFWPMSRAHHPKQFLAIGGDRSLLAETIDRVAADVPRERILVVTARVHAAHVRAVAPELATENVLVEPVGRNTAACIGWATRVIEARSPDATIAVLPSDHFIGDLPGFRRHLAAAFEAAADDIVLCGIVPTRAETGYGYVRAGEVVGRVDGMKLCAVEEFCEKPDEATAKRYVDDGRYLWNGGMFIYPARVMLSEIRQHLPELARGLDELEREPAAHERIYPRLPAISIDYGVMEKTRRVRVMPSSFGWSDVGSWDAAMEIHPHDASGNVALGDVVAIDVHGSMIDARAGRLVAVVDLDDIIVVDTKDALLVIRRGRSQDVRKIVEALKAQGRDMV